MYRKAMMGIVALCGLIAAAWAVNSVLPLRPAHAQYRAGSFQICPAPGGGIYMLDTEKAILWQGSPSPGKGGRKDLVWVSISNPFSKADN